MLAHLNNELLHCVQAIRAGQLSHGKEKATFSSLPSFMATEFNLSARGAEELFSSGASNAPRSLLLQGYLQPMPSDGDRAEWVSKHILHAQNSLHLFHNSQFIFRAPTPRLCSRPSSSSTTLAFTSLVNTSSLPAQFLFSSPNFQIEFHLHVRPISRNVNSDGSDESEEGVENLLGLEWERSFSSFPAIFFILINLLFSFGKFIFPFLLLPSHNCQSFLNFCFGFNAVQFLVESEFLSKI